MGLMGRRSHSFPHNPRGQKVSKHKDKGALKPGRSMRAKERRLRHTLMLAALSILYGGGHLVAWNVDFPTRIERCICRASAISFAGSIPVLWSIHMADEFLPSKDGGTGIYRMIKVCAICSYACLGYVDLYFGP
jgi:hypothetical protein